MNKVVNIIAMQIGWFACVVGAANNLPWTGVLISTVLAAWHLTRSEQPAAELKLILSAVVMGFVLDSTLSTSGLMKFTSGTLVAGLTTPWMLCLWAGFATTLNTSLRWLVTRPLIAVLFGAVGGPAAYWSRAKLGALTLGNTIASLIAIGIGWAIAMSLFTRLAQRFNSTALLQEALT